MLKPILVTALLACLGAQAGLRTTWEKTAAEYADVLDRTADKAEGLERIQSILNPWLEKQGRRYLKDGVELTLAITEFDLAGRPVPISRAGVRGGRKYDDFEKPLIKLQWTLKLADGSEPKTGEVELTDTPQRLSSDAFGEDSLPLEKVLIRNWLRKFCKEQDIRR